MKTSSHVQAVRRGRAPPDTPVREGRNAPGGPAQGASSWLALAVSLVALALYVCALAPGLAWGDGAEFQTLVPELGLPHPTGYPTYTLLGWLFGQLPLGTEPWRMNLFSACSAAGAVGLAFLLARALGCRPSVAAGCALLLAAGRTFWSQAVTTEVYALSTLFLLACVFLLVRLRIRPSRRTLLALAVVFALGLGHHLTLYLLTPVVVASVALALRGAPRDVRRAAWPAALVVALAVVAIYVHAVLRLRHELDLSTEGALELGRYYVLGGSFHAKMLGSPPAEALAKASLAVRHLGEELSWPGVALAVLGLLRPAPGRVLVAVVCLGSLLLFSQYDVPDARVFQIPAYVFAAVLAGSGAEALARRCVPQAIPALLLVCLALAGVVRHWSANDRSRDDEARRWVEDVLLTAPPESLVLVDWRCYWPLRYALEREGRRPDCTLQLAAPKRWPAAVAQAPPGRPVLVGARAEALASGVAPLERVGPLWRVRRDPGD